METAGSRGIEHTMFFKAISEVDTSRDYTIIIDRSASMKLKGRWKEAEEACKCLCDATCKADPDGITLYFFSSHSKTSKGETPSFTKYENIATGNAVMEQFKNKANEPHGGTDLVTVLKDALYPPGSKPQSVLVITDGCPDDKEAVAILFKDTANALVNPTDLFVTILQVGDDAKGDEYLVELDEGLDKLGCKVDIIDVVAHKHLKEMHGTSFSFAKVVAESVVKADVIAKDPEAPKLSAGIVASPQVSARKTPTPAAKPAPKPAPAPKKVVARAEDHSHPEFTAKVAAKVRPVSKKPKGPKLPGFSRFVEVGRVALINYGPNVGKLCTIINIVDNNRLLIDGPQSVTGVCRQIILAKRLSLTDITVEGINYGCKAQRLEKAWKEQEIMNEWLSTEWAQKIERKQTRASLSDFDRFKVMVAKKQRSKLIAAKMGK